MIQRSRRDFLKDVGAGVVAASIGTSLAADLGFSTAFADDGPDRLTFGTLEPLVRIMQETAAPQLIPRVIERMRQGTSLRDVVAATALANARTFGGEDYVGFHTMMAIAPAFYMAGELPENRKALPVLKVIYRNASRIQEFGGPAREVLHPVQPATLPANQPGNDALREAVRRQATNEAEGIFAALANGNPDAALNNILHVIEDGAEVHRVVMPYRAWDLAGLIGRDHAHTLLRQSVRYCIRSESPNQRQYYGNLRTLIPQLLDRHNLLTRAPGTRMAEDRWVDEFSQTLFRSTPEQAAEAAAAALAEGIDPSAISEAISLAANQLVLRDNGRPTDEAPNKPRGSVHGDSVGVHGCDSANAWRNLARVSNARNRAVCLIMGAWQVARDRANPRGAELLNNTPYPREDARELVRNVERDRLLPTLEDAIRNRDQVRAAAAVHRYGELNMPVRPVWDVLLRFAISEDGALHAEKFYRTATEEFASSRAAFRWRQLIALARVTASEHGYAAPGHTEACRLLEA